MTKKGNHVKIQADLKCNQNVNAVFTSSVARELIHRVGHLL